MKKIEIFNDPIYGFVRLQNKLIFEIIEHPYFQRLRRISQMGLSYLVYPGAHHTRFHHVIGCGFLMEEAIYTLRLKEVEISKEEEEALFIAILLHDIGHGPFSHALEHSIVDGLNHEEISMLFMNELNRQFDGKLSLAIQIFKDEHPRKFLHQLISSQLDMDRLDYLKRDSFYTGVAEGNINAERLITMLNVKNEELVLEENGIYSVEKFIVARRLMYWQVYLHKAGVAAEYILVKTLQRAKELTGNGEDLKTGGLLDYFLCNKIDKKNFDKETLEKFALLDDSDIIFALKKWMQHSDFTLAYLSKSIIYRKLPKIIIRNEEFSKVFLKEKSEEVSKQFPISNEELSYFVFTGEVENKAYNPVEKGIDILKKNGEIIDIVAASDQLNLKALTNPVTKHFICYPKEI
ncbi:MAG: HD domain-containing protein [Bacteroidota bacterium]